VTAITTIAARSGQTVVFGGLITSERTDTFRGVPYLSDIPVLGHLFRFDTESDKRNELLFFLTPHIVMEDEDVEVLNQREADRMSWCLADVVQIHGDPGFGASRTDSWNEGTPLIYPSVDPTAEGAMPLEGVEAVPVPPGQSVMESGAPSTEEKPFVLPPEQRQEGKPFILPPGERQEGKPFILPPDEQQEGKPFIEKKDQSMRRNRGARIELQPAVGWQAPRLQDPFPASVTTPAPLNSQVITAAAQETVSDQPPGRLANVPPTTIQTPYQAAPYPQRPYSEFPHVK
jgi:general secretion pathway protein D